GLDLSEETVRIARAATDEADRIDYQVGDIFDFRSTAGIDFVASSLLTHHLSDQLIIKFLGWMEGTARKGWLIYTSSATSYPIISWASLAPCCACIRWSSMMAASQLPVRSRVASGEHGGQRPAFLTMQLSFAGSYTVLSSDGFDETGGNDHCWGWTGRCCNRMRSCRLRTRGLARGASERTAP